MNNDAVMENRILGIDYGTRRIGVAVSDPLGITARGLTVVDNAESAIREIGKIADEYGVGMIVVGMPLNLKGEKGAKAREVEDFAGRLRSELRRTVVCYDERFTTRSAHQSLRDAGIRKSQRRSKERIDMIASALILQNYLDLARSERERKAATEE